MPYADPKVRIARQMALHREKCANDSEYREKRRMLTRAWRAKNPDKYSMSGKKSSMKSRRKSRYSMEEGTFERLLVEQSNKCKICTVEFRSIPGKSYRPHVDHDHVTGKIRGLLCNGCNAALGHFQDDI